MCDNPRTCLGARFFSVSGFPSALPRLTGDFRARKPPRSGRHGPRPMPTTVPGGRHQGRGPSLGESPLPWGRLHPWERPPPWGRSPPRGGVDWLTSTNQLKYNGESCGFYAILWNLRSNPQGHIKLNYET